MTPTIHLNGTSASQLLSALEKANGAICAACDALQETAPNMRDYYVQPDGEANFAKARDALQADLTAMHNILHRLQFVWETIQEQAYQRNAS